MRGRRRFAVGVLCGIALVFAFRVFVNATPVADWLVQPLVVDDTDGPVDAILVSGAGVIGECIPNRNGTQRVLRAARLWREGRAPAVVITGGSGPRGCPVAEAMARLMREVGVPASNVRVETASRNTRDNGAFVAPLLRGWGFSRVLLVTDQLHMRRAGGVLMAEGLDVERSAVPIFEGHPDNVSMLQAGLREYAALAYYWIRGWTTRGTARSASPDAPRRSAGPLQSTRSDGPVVVLGASYAAGLTLTRVAAIPVVNRGVAGQESSDLLERFDRDVAALRPRAVILWGFINDIVRAPGNGMDVTIARVRDNYTRLVRRARDAGVTPIVATELSIGPAPGVLNVLAGWLGAVRGKESYEDRVNRHVLAVNRWLVDLAEREHLLVLDLQPVLAAPDGRRRTPFTQPDGSHVTDEGYDLLVSYAEPILEEFFRGR